ncbi:hypothetical protein BWQ96_08626 [Gracilariopsis chorda]|uniref:DUF1279 domain-containing protein n=1 Tax=Gracilariopsis chorda TaxID=448386 RepID=A0A2V3IHM7_9FLOR|nr:hypothetical protein BWQ96_08626 [Gracilariopsis chorda]|eukprot:PXF41615.1 hypothetical protein BWQ96_08626 [Gracilariopsis chorda]
MGTGHGVNEKATTVAFITSGAIALKSSSGISSFTTGSYGRLTRARVPKPKRVRVSLDSCKPSHTPTRMANSNSKQPDAKELAKLFGFSYLGTSIAMSIVSYAVLYVMVAVGVDVRALMNSLGNFLASTPLGRPSIIDNISDTASTAALAYIAHKAMSPIRFPLTAAATPVVASFFSKKGSDSEEKTS